MCIICVKKAGVERPKNEWLDQMCKRNSDGFGIAYYRNGKTTVKKTLNAEEFKRWVRSLPDSTPAIMHMRIATHGSVRVGNCHPFLSGDGHVAFAHNGVLSLENEKDKTDSETFFRRIALPVSRVYPIGSKEFDAMVDSLIGTSKFAFMQDGKLTTYGKYIEDEGLLFSNESYKPYQLPALRQWAPRWDDYDDYEYAYFGGHETDPRIAEKYDRWYSDWFDIIESLDDDCNHDASYPDYNVYRTFIEGVSGPESSYLQFSEAWRDYYYGTIKK